MVTKIMKWVSITALLLTVFWRPSASLDFVVCAGAILVVLALFFIKQENQDGARANHKVQACAGAILVVLALFFIKQEIETYYGVDNRSKPERRVTVRL